MEEHALKNRVRELRERLNMRQSDLADEIGVTRQTILAIEKGRLNPSVTVCLKIARVLREPLDYVFYLEPGQVAAPADMPKPAPTPKPLPKEQPVVSRRPSEDQADEKSQAIFDFL